MCLPEESPGTPQASVAKREAPVAGIDWRTPPLESRIQAGTPEAAVALTEEELYHPELHPIGLQQCARCGLVARPQHLQYRSGCSWLCDFHFAVADLEDELSSLGYYHVRRTDITKVVQSARDFCLTPTGKARTRK